MTKRRTREEGIEFYAPVKAKAAMDCKETLRDLKEWFPHDEISFKLGYHADSDKMVLEHIEHDKGEPDIFVCWQGCVVCAVEVTGSDKVSMPVDVWISKTKMEYAEAAKFPVAYALYYLGSRHFVAAGTVRQNAAKPQERIISGYSEYYHILDPRHVSKFADLEKWVRDQIVGHVLYKGGGRIANALSEDPSPF